MLDTKTLLLQIREAVHTTTVTDMSLIENASSQELSEGPTSISTIQVSMETAVFLGICNIPPTLDPS